MSGQKDDPATGRDGPLQVLRADDAVRRQLVEWFPPAGRRLEEPEGQGLEVGEGEGVDFGRRLLREAEPEVDQHDVAAQADDVEDKPRQCAGEAAALGPGEQAGAGVEEPETGPHRPVLRQPEVRLLAGAAHAFRG